MEIVCFGGCRVQPAIEKVSKELREVSSQLTRMQPTDKSCRDEIDEQKRRQRGDDDSRGKNVM